MPTRRGTSIIRDNKTLGVLQTLIPCHCGERGDKTKGGSPDLDGGYDPFPPLFAIAAAGGGEGGGDREAPAGVGRVAAATLHTDAARLTARCRWRGDGE